MKKFQLLQFPQIRIFDLMLPTAFKDLSKKSFSFFLISFALYFSFGNSAWAQSTSEVKAHTTFVLNECQLENERIPLSLLDQENGNYCFTLRAKSKDLVLEISKPSQGIKVSIQESASQANCEPDAGSDISEKQKLIGTYYKVVTSKLVPGKKYSIIISNNSNPDMTLYVLHSSTCEPVEKSTKSVAMKDLSSKHKMSDKSEKLNSTPELVEVRIEELTKKISSMKANMDNYNQEDIDNATAYLEKLRKFEKHVSVETESTAPQKRYIPLEEYTGDLENLPEGVKKIRSVRTDRKTGITVKKDFIVLPE